MVIGRGRLGIGQTCCRSARAAGSVVEVMRSPSRGRCRGPEQARFERVNYHWR
jgi:hypothetical protein